MRPDDRERANPLPVFASTEGDEPDTMLIAPRNPIDKIPRPRQVQVRDAFAVYLVGESMSPVYDENDELYVHPHLRPRPEDDCLFVHEREDGSLLVQVKRLVKARPDKWRVHQFNPHKDFDLDRRKWTKAWTIVGKMNRAS